MRTLFRNYALLGALVSAPFLGYGTLFRAAPAKNEKPQSDYGQLGGNIALLTAIRNYDLYSLEYNGTDRAVAFYDGSAVGLSFTPSIEWKRLAAIKANLSGGVGSETINGFRDRIGFMDTDLTVTLFAPLFKTVQLGMIGGWEYRFQRIRSKLNTGSYITQNLTYLNGAIGGFSFCAQPIKTLSMTMGALGHMPAVTSKLRTAYNEPFLKRRLHGGRFGLSAFAELNYQFTERTSLQFAFESTRFDIKGDSHKSTEGYDNEIDHFFLGYNQYTFGLNTTF